MKTFRFDDISINTNSEHLHELLSTIYEHAPYAHILLAISPVVFSPHQLPEDQKQRVHPRRLTALSSLIPYYQGESCGVPEIRQQLAADPRVRFAAHAMAHVDHRLLSFQTQELSILMSCALARASTFIPPYNKYNEDTETICHKHGITLVRFEEGWKHVLYNCYDADHERYYLHPYDQTRQELASWFRGRESRDS